MARKSGKLKSTPAELTTPVATLELVGPVQPTTIPAKEEAKGIKGMTKLAIYRQSYVRATHNGDHVAAALDGKDLMTVTRVGSVVLGVSIEELVQKYAHLNAGQRRMNIGNRIRAAVRKDATLMAKVTETIGA